MKLISAKYLCHRAEEFCVIAVAEAPWSSYAGFAMNFTEKQ
ncbi:MAG: hypothetical protein ACK5PS_19235 [Desulfopila sp.]